jgi:hypothetical protein
VAFLVLRQSICYSMRFAYRLRNFPFHIAGIITFFLIHGYSEHIGLIPFLDLFLFFVVHVLAAGLVFWFFKWRLKSATRAGLLTTFIFSFYLFYGAIADYLKGVSFLTWLSHYRSLLTVFLLGILLLFRYCKRSKDDFQKVTLYLNSVFLLLIVYDLVFITLHSGNSHISGKKGAVINATAGHFEKRPDIYFILMDEYSGSRALKTYFNYDNSRFEQLLKQQGFFVAASSKCNYTATVYSMAATLSMNYLGWLGDRKENAFDYAQADKLISANETMQFLKSNGYTLYNYSIFDIDGQPSRFNPGLFSFKLKLITAKTLLKRIEKDLLWKVQVGMGGNVDWIGERMQHKFKAGNKEVLRLTREVTAIQGQPKFVYSHLLMPHPPFSYDSTGAEVNISAWDKKLDPEFLNKAYLQYLVHTNKVVGELINDLLQKTNRQAVIILMSDHGYRSLIVNGKTMVPDNNFTAVYIPGSNYTYYYDSISNVNQFRAMFNSLFDTRIPLLPDSCTCYRRF